MKRTVATLLVLAFVFMFTVVSGCAEKRTGTVPMKLPKTGATRTAPPPSTPPSTTERKTPTPPLDAVPPGMTRVRHYEPGGKAAGSPFLVERLAPKEVRAGQPFAYTLKVTNVSDKDLADVTLKELIPDNTTIQSTDPDTTSKTDTHLVWRYGELKADQSARVTIKAVASKTGLVTPCVEVTYRPTAVCVGINVVQPRLELVKTAPASALTCEVIPLTLTVRNAGTGAAENVVVRDPLPKGMTSLDGKSTLVLEAGTLQPGQSKRFTEKVKVSAAGTYTNAATAQAGGGLRASSAQISTEVHQPMLAVVKKGPETRYVGRPVEYAITVSNTGKVPAAKTVLSDTVPAGAKFVKASTGGRVQNGKVVWNLGTIPAGEARNVTITLVAQAPATLRSTASATAVCCEASAAATTVVKGIPAILLECVDNPDPIEVGTNTTYTITVTNQGSAVGTGIQITCIMPAELDYVSSTGPTKAATDGKAITFAPLAELAPKAKATYRVVVKGTKAGDVRFSVKLKSNQMTSSADETESTHIYE